MFLIFVIFLCGCQNENSNIKGVKGLYINNSIVDYDPLLFNFKDDSLFILYPYRSDVLKNKVTLNENNILHLNNSEFTVNLELTKNLDNEEFIIAGGKNTVSVGDTISLEPVYFKELSVDNKSMSGYWYSEDFFPLEQGVQWLKFEKNKLILKSEYGDNDIALQELDFSLNSFGRIKVLSVKFLNSDAIFFFDKINDNEIQLFTILPTKNNKYFVHLNKIDQDEYNSARLKKLKEELSLPQLD